VALNTRYFTSGKVIVSASKDGADWTDIGSATVSNRSVRLPLAAGFFPADCPQWVVVIGFGSPKTDHCAGRVALPVFADIVRKITSGPCR
jgi:hypothetical protein